MVSFGWLKFYFEWSELAVVIGSISKTTELEAKFNLVLVKLIIKKKARALALV